MIKKTAVSLTFFTAVFIISACSSPPPSPPAAVNSSNTVNNTPPASATGDVRFWSTRAEYGSLIFHGVSEIFSRREDSVQAALEDAARRVALFKKLEGNHHSVTRSGGGFFSNTSETNSSLLYDEDYKQYVEFLTFDPENDVREFNNTIFVRTRYQASLPIPVSSHPTSSFHSASRPDWTNHPPVISGYIVGVGHSGRQSPARRTITNSYESAVFSMIINLFSEIDVRTVQYRGQGAFDVVNVTEQEIKAHGVLYNFYILDMWFDSESHAVWTLAIARNQN